MTWKQFKDAVEAQGLKDDDELWYIDWHGDDPVTVESEQGATKKWFNVH